MCQIMQDVGQLRFYFSQQKYFGTIHFCRMSQDVGKLRCRNAQVPLYNHCNLEIIIIEVRPEFSGLSGSSNSTYTVVPTVVFDLLYT